MYKIILACKQVTALMLLFALHISPVVAGQVLGHLSLDEETVWERVSECQGKASNQASWLPGQDCFQHAAGTTSPLYQVSKVWCTCAHWWPVARRAGV